MRCRRHNIRTGFPIFAAGFGPVHIHQRAGRQAGGVFQQGQPLFHAGIASQPAQAGHLQGGGNHTPLHTARRAQAFLLAQQQHAQAQSFFLQVCGFGKFVQPCGRALRVKGEVAPGAAFRQRAGAGMRAGRGGGKAVLLRQRPQVHDGFAAQPRSRFNEQGLRVRQGEQGGCLLQHFLQLVTALLIRLAFQFIQDVGGADQPRGRRQFPHMARYGVHAAAPQHDVPRAVGAGQFAEKRPSQFHHMRGKIHAQHGQRQVPPLGARQPQGKGEGQRAAAHVRQQARLGASVFPCQRGGGRQRQGRQQARLPHQIPRQKITQIG